ncbi:piggyBac transposable element-derived protein 4-like [Sardina pilchardus]|uniref:piggyBac transposable element-derived protein 4-like n=1 Tax=Sardina pilchardus TaxID=27697 RepID=UPI002E0FCD98
MISPDEAALPIQDQHELAIESDDDTDISSEDSDDERMHFEFRLDPIEDIYDEYNLKEEEDILPKLASNVEEVGILPKPAGNVEEVGILPKLASDVEEEGTLPEPASNVKGEGTLPEPASIVKEEDLLPEPAGKKARYFSWKTECEEDTTPPPLRFVPSRDPGVQLRAEDNHTPLSLFKLFFSLDTVETLCRNTNKHAARNIARGAKYRWVDVRAAEFYKFIGLIFYMGMIQMKNITDYWRKCNIFSVPFPSEMISRDRYRTIFWNVSMSDPDEDRENDAKKGTPLYDKLFRVKPLMETIQNVSMTFYHPRRNLSVDERMVASRSNVMRQYMKDKPTKWGFKLFVLADSSNGYTINFSIYTGKTRFSDGRGLSYNAVMSLIKKKYFGSGYHIYMDNFYTSTRLFKALHAVKFGACGTYRDSRRDFPHSNINALTKRSPRGAMRWIREGPFVYVKWMDTREVCVCSSIHAAYAGDTVDRRVKDRQGSWSKQAVPCPKPVMEYNKYMGGVDLSDQLIQYYTSQHKTARWYKKLFLHFLDMAATNAYILHKELLQSMHKKSISHKQFMEELTAELCGVSLTFLPPKAPVQKAGETCMPVCGIDLGTDGNRSSDGRRGCVYCRLHGKQTKTQWKCSACSVYLCLQQGRNCFVAWHEDGKRSVEDV